MKKKAHRPQPAGAWSDFLRQVAEARASLGCAPADKVEPWFRGHSKSNYQLLPSLFRLHQRPNDGKNWDEIFALESDFFWEFAARAKEIHGVIEDDWDILAAMQHFGTPTRLLDWTESLGAAVYFAILGIDETKPVDRNGCQLDERNSEVQPPCVWVLNPYRLNYESEQEPFDRKRKLADLVAPKNLGWDEDEGRTGYYYSYSELLAEDGVDWDWPLAIYPRQRNARVHAQRGWFTIHGDKFVPIDKIEGHENYVRKVELPFAAVRAARDFLDAAGIDHYLLFSDLENLSLHLMEKNGYLSRRQAEQRVKERLDRRNPVPRKS